VLLVEDDLVSASALTAILSRRGFHVLHATTVAVGLELLAEQPDTVILDLMLPDGDGAALLQHVRAAGLRVRVVVTTAVHDVARLAAVRALGPDLLMQKPIDLADLLTVLKPLN
jgi:DNA-binding response OmpR family regulator